MLDQPNGDTRVAPCHREPRRQTRDGEPYPVAGSKVPGKSDGLFLLSEILNGVRNCVESIHVLKDPFEYQF